MTGWDGWEGELEVQCNAVTPGQGDLRQGGVRAMTQCICLGARVALLFYLFFIPTASAERHAVSLHLALKLA